MSDSAIQLALDTRLDAFVATLTPRLDVAWENVAYSPVVGTPYLGVKMVARVQQPLGVGLNARRQWTGVYQISVYRPTGDGSQASLVLAETIAAHFYRGLTLTAGDVVLKVERYNLAPSLQMPDWVMVPLEVHWFAH